MTGSTVTHSTTAFEEPVQEQQMTDDYDQMYENDDNRISQTPEVKQTSDGTEQTEREPLHSTNMATTSM